MGNCPHGVPRPVTVADLRNLPSTPSAKMAAVQRVIWDSSSCPDCLQERIKAADAILNLIFITPGANVDRYEVYRLWSDYACRYNP